MDEITLYFRHADGAVSQVTTNQARDAVTGPEGAEAITAEAYAKEHAAITAVNEEHLAALRLEEGQRQADDYEALRAAGIPEQTAKRLTGYSEPESVPEGRP